MKYCEFNVFSKIFKGLIYIYVSMRKQMEQLLKCSDEIEAGLSYRNSGDCEDIESGGKLSGSV